jgi:hypothetical protein
MEIRTQPIAGFGLPARAGASFEMVVGKRRGSTLPGDEVVPAAAPQGSAKGRWVRIYRAVAVAALLFPAVPGVAQAKVPGMAAIVPGAIAADADDRAISAAAAAACAGETGRTLHLPAGIHELRRAIVLPCGLTLLGDGDASVLHPAPGIDAVTFSTTERVQIQNLAITYSSAASKGTAAIRCDVPTGSSQTGLTVRDVTINNADTGIAIVDCPFFILSANRIFSFASVGISVANPTNADVGDGVIENNSLFNFTGTTKAQVGIAWTSGGGLRIMNNKFGALYGGALFRLADGAHTSQLFIQGNSFDTMDGYGARFERSGAVATLSDVLWNGNVCTSCTMGLSIPRDANGQWINNIVATGNTFIGRKQPGVRAFAIDSARDVVISANTLFSNHEQSVPVSLGSGVAGAVVGPLMTAGPWRPFDISAAEVTQVRGAGAR